MRRNSHHLSIREIVAIALLALIMVFFGVRSIIGNISSHPAHMDFPAYTEFYSFEPEDVDQELEEEPISGDYLELALSVYEDDTLEMAYVNRHVTGSLERYAVWEHGNLYHVIPAEDSDFASWSATFSAPDGGSPHNGKQTWMLCFNDYELGNSRSAWLTLNADGSAVYGNAWFNVFEVNTDTRAKNEISGTWHSASVGGRPATVVDVAERRLVFYTTQHSQNVS